MKRVTDLVVLASGRFGMACRILQYRSGACIFRQPIYQAEITEVFQAETVIEICCAV